jgi:hypothetical protein
VAWAAGFQPWAVLDTDGASGGRLGRLIEGLAEERLRLGVYLERGSALVFDPRSPRLVARGSDGVIVLDLSNARRQADALREARLSRLAAGDAWVRRGREGIPAPGSRPARVEDRAEEVRVDDVLSARTLAGALSAWAREPVPRRLTVRDDLCALTVEVDEDAAVWVREGGGAGLAHLAFALEWNRP